MIKLIKTKKTPEQLAIEQAKDDKPSQDNTLVDMPITEHLIELRRHLIHGFAAVLVIFLALAGFSREIYDIFSAPLTALLPVNSSMIATDITSSFLAPIKLTLYLAVILASRIFCTKFGRLSPQGYISMKNVSPYPCYCHR